jgi:hypothetical protein
MRHEILISYTNLNKNFLAKLLSHELPTSPYLIVLLWHMYDEIVQFV